MFMYGLTAGSIIPLTIVYLIRPESLTNLFDFLSSSLFLALNWSDGVAQRFNLSLDLFSSHNQNTLSTIKMYSCYTIEYWYNIFSSIIYICFFLTIILFIYKQRLKNSQEYFLNENHESIDIDMVFYYFCIFIFAIISILIRLFMEYYLLGYLKLFTIVYLLWYIISFAFVWLWNR